MLLALTVLGIVGSTLADDPSRPATDPWRFVRPSETDAFAAPLWRTIALARTQPNDVVEKVTYRGTTRRYGQIRFGSPSSVRVTVVLDTLGTGKADLYVDADRNRRIETRDRLEGEGRIWQLPLDAAFVEGEITRTESRSAAFRLGATGATLSFAAPGYLEGTVRLGDRELAARRTDGDGNGLWTDPDDRLWIDLNGDGRWDAASEQFAYGPTLTIAGTRYAVRSEPNGQWLTLAPLIGGGTVRLVLGPSESTRKIQDLQATLVARDGAAIGLHRADDPVTVPAGDYRLATLVLTLADPVGGLPWTYVFSENGRRGEPLWHEVGKDAQVVIDPVGLLNFTVDDPGPATIPASPGTIVSVRPRLFTADGLSIVTCYRGSPTQPGSDAGPGASITLVDTSSSQRVDSAHSGFA